MIEKHIAEATECDFKVALEMKKPKSWLKSVSAFANSIGGTLFFGVADDLCLFLIHPAHPSCSFTYHHYTMF